MKPVECTSSIRFGGDGGGIGPRILQFVEDVVFGLGDEHDPERRQLCNLLTGDGHRLDLIIGILGSVLAF